MKNLRIVNHVKQGIIECYSFGSLYDWALVPRSVAAEWRPDSFDYIELIHSMTPKNGIYGPYITI